jgi:FtsP/CotA-like multicopper oxidase with cupredoxin domain
MARSSVQPLAAERPEEDTKLLPPGTKAPNFTLHIRLDQTLTLSDLAGNCHAVDHEDKGMMGIVEVVEG